MEKEIAWLTNHMANSIVAYRMSMGKPPAMIVVGPTVYRQLEKEAMALGSLSMMAIYQIHGVMVARSITEGWELRGAPPTGEQERELRLQEETCAGCGRWIGYAEMAYRVPADDGWPTWYHPDCWWSRADREAKV